MLVPIDQQIAVGLVAVSSDSASQLVQFGQPIAIGIVDEHGVGIGDIEPAFDDGCRQQDIGAVLDKIEHDLLEPVLLHLTVSDDDPRFGRDPLKFCRDVVHVFDAIVDKVDLAVAIEFAEDCVADHRIVPSDHPRFDRHTILGRGFEVRDVPNADKGHMERPRDRGRREGQDIDFGRCPLDSFFELDSKLLLFVDDQQSEIEELHIARGEPVRTDDDIDMSFG